jgi:DNA primase
MKSKLIHITETILNEKGNETSKQNHSYHCPFCNHVKRKLEICYNDTNFGTWHCWVCNLGGFSIHSLLKKIKVQDSILSETYQLESELNKTLKRTYRVEQEQKDDIKKLELPKEFISLSNLKTITNETEQVLEYLSKRNIRGIDIIRYNIGYCIDGDFKDRIIIPNYNDKNELNYFVGRYYKDNKCIIKYHTPDVNKSDVIGYENLLNFNLDLFLLEGSFDAITFKFNACPLYGKTLSKRLMMKLIKTSPPNLYMILDADAIKQSLELIRKLLKQITSNIYIVMLDNEDPNELGIERLQYKVFNEGIRIKDGMDIAKLKMKLNL